MILIHFFANSQDEVSYIMAKMYPDLKPQCESKGEPVRDIIGVMSNHLQVRVSNEEDDYQYEGSQTCQEIIDAGPESEQARKVGDKAKEIIRVWREEKGGKPKLQHWDQLYPIVGGKNDDHMWLSLADPDLTGSADY